MIHTVVVHLKDSTILRGYYRSENSELSSSKAAEMPRPGAHQSERSFSAGISSDISSLPVDLPSAMSIEQEDGTGSIVIALEDAKAVFFVRSFAGSPKQQDVRFFDSLSIHPLLWVRITFLDGETMEGRVSNGIGLLTENAFRLFPVDEFANNRCLFVPKHSLSSFQIIGLLEEQIPGREIAFFAN